MGGVSTHRAGVKNPAAGGGAPSGPAAYKSNGGLAVVANSPTVAPAFPAGVANFDIAILHVCHQTTLLNPNTATIGTPAGWTLLDGPKVQQSMVSYVFWKRCDGTETGTVTCTATAATGANGPMSAVISLWTGCPGTGTPYEAAANTSATGTTAMTGSAVTTTAANERVVSVYVTENDPVSAPDTGWTEDYELTSTTGNDVAQTGSSILKVAAGLQAAEARTLSLSTRWISHSFALKSQP